MARAAPIDELVGLLGRWSPSSLDAIRTKYPNQQELLRPGIVAGNSGDEVGVRLDVCIAGLKAAADACTNGLNEIKKKLRFANTTQFAGQLTTIIAGASIFGVLAVNVPSIARYTAAILALIGSVLTFVAQHSLRAAGAKDANLLDIYSELVDCRVNAQTTLQELEIAHATGNASDPGDLIKSANAIAARVTRLVSIALV